MRSVRHITGRVAVAAAVLTAGFGATLSSANSGSAWQSPSSAPVPSRGNTALVAAGHDGWAYDNSRGYVFGNSTTGTQNLTVPAANAGSLAGKSVIAFEADEANQCAIASDTSLHCWGGYTSSTAKATMDVYLAGVGVAVKEPKQIFASGVSSVGVGPDHTCAIVSGNALCWGDPSSVTGSSTTKPATAQPTAPTGLPPVISISADSGKTCAIDRSAAAWCWGASGLELGINATASTPYPPTKLAGSLTGKRVVQVSTGDEVGCAVDSVGGLHCWGADGAYAGTGTAGRVLVPVQVAGSVAGKHIVQVSVSDKTHFALDSAGGLHSWGFNDVPTAVTQLGSLAGKRVVQIRADESHRCAIDSTGTAHCWGDNGYGQLGIGSTSQVSGPTAVTGGALAKKAVVSVTPHDEITFFITADPLMSFPAGVKDSGNVTLDLAAWSAGLAKAGATLGASGKAKANGAKITMPVVRGGKKHMMLDGNIDITASDGSKVTLAAPIIDLTNGQVTAVAYGVSAPHNGNRVPILTIDPKVKKQKTVTTKTRTQTVTTKTTKGLATTAALPAQLAFPGDAFFPGEIHTPGSPAGTFSSSWKATKSLKKK